VRNVNIINIETAESFKVVFDSWNCRTNVGGSLVSLTPGVAARLRVQAAREEG